MRRVAPPCCDKLDLPAFEMLARDRQEARVEQILLDQIVGEASPVRVDIDAIVSAISWALM